MLLYLMLAASLFTMASQSVIVKFYGRKAPDHGNFSYTFLATCFALLVFLCSFFVKNGANFVLSGEYIGYSFGFAACFASAMIGQVVALATGPMSVTALIISYSLIIPTLYGLLFLNEPIGLFTIPGLILLVISTALVNTIDKKNDTVKPKKLWYPAILLAFFGNGGCSTVQKLQGVNCKGRYSNEFMIVALVIVLIILIAAAAITERKKIAATFRSGWAFAACHGICNGLTNMFVILMGAALPASLMFPVISAGGMVVISLASIFLFREKLSKLQTAGVIIGILSIVLLNL